MRMLAPMLFALAGALLPAAQAQELPGRVGRIAHIEGRASIYQDPDAGWEKAYVNTPVTSENSVWTDEGSRAELRVSGTAMRLDELSQLDLSRLDDDEVEAFIPRGSVAVRVRHYESNERLVFSTPNARVRLRGDGRYRIDVDHEREETRVTVFAGEARIGTGDGRMRISAGRSVLIFGEPAEFVDERARIDSFDRWVQARDERWREGRAPTYVSTYMTGYEDLDAHGEWVAEPDYGTLWFPTRVASTWAPYRYGHWSYVRPWGWTWIDDAPWGYAPFHYGRWVYVRNRWAWHPGERVARPAWAPALVGWIGGSNFNVRVTSGGPSVGWYPLSPWDRYDPWFNASPTYVNRVNIVVRGDRPTRDDRRRWHEWTRERGTTVVDRSALIDRRPIAQAAIPITVEAIRRAESVSRPEAILPSRSDFIARQRQQPQPAAPAPTVVQRPPGRPDAPAAQQPPGRSAIARPDFGRRTNVDAPQQASSPPGRGAPAAEQPATAQPRAPREEREREVRERTERAIREAQQPGQGPQREAQQQQERAAREAAQQQQQQRQAQERAQREAQQQQERAQREAQQQQERSQREGQQQQERAAREAAQQQQQQQQLQQQRQAQERAQREAQQQQERAAREAAQQQQQQQQQRQAQERVQREAQQQQERAAREAAQQQQQQQQQQRQAQERAQREAQQQQERAAREAARQQQQQQQQQPAQQQGQDRAQREAQQQQERAAREAAQRQQRDKDHKNKEKDKEKEKDDKEKGRGR